MEDAVMEGTVEETGSLWDPWGVLRQPEPESDSRCIGQTNGAVRCRNPISSGSMQQAMKTMVELARMPLRSPDVPSYLLRLAGLHLCRRWHQGQRDEIVHRWRGQLSRLPTLVRREPLPPSPTDYRDITLETLRQRGFHPTERLVGRIGLGANATVTIAFSQRLSQFPDEADEACAICRGTLCTDTDYLRCLSCREGRDHWSCFQSWGSTWGRTHADAEMLCQIYHTGNRFAIFHQAHAQLEESTVDPMTETQTSTADHGTVARSSETRPSS